MEKQNTSSQQQALNAEGAEITTAESKTWPSNAPVQKGQIIANVDAGTKAEAAVNVIHKKHSASAKKHSDDDNIVANNPESVVSSADEEAGDMLAQDVESSSDVAAIDGKLNEVEAKLSSSDFSGQEINVADNSDASATQSDAGGSVVPAATADAGSATTSAEHGAVSAAASTESSNYLPILALAGGGLAIAAAAGGGGGGGGSAVAPAPTASTTIGGTFTAGPALPANGLSVSAYKADGTRLGTAKLSDTGTFSITYTTSYSGPVLLKVTDASAGNDYMDEASRSAKDSDSTLYAATSVAGSGNYTVNITPYSTVAAKLIGMTGDALNTTDPATVSSYNVAVAKLFGISATSEQVTAVTATPVVDVYGAMQTPNVYGQLLSILSSAEQQDGTTADSLIATLMSGITVSGSTASWKTDAAGDAAKSILADGISRAVQNGLLNSSTSLTLMQTLLLNPADTTPQVLVYADRPYLKAGESSTIYFKLTVASNDFGAADIAVSGGTLGTLSQSTTDPTLYSATFTPSASNTLSSQISVGASTFSDVTGLTFNSAASPVLTLSGDTLAPVAPSVALVTDSGSSNTDNITNDGTLSVTGTESGATVEYSTDNSTWGASFTAAAGANTVYVRQVDTVGNVSTATTLSFTLDVTSPTVSGAAITTATGAQSNTLNAGDVVTITVTMSEATDVTGTPQLALNIGGTTVQANYVSGSGSTSLVFTYTIQAAQNDANGISIPANALSLNGGTLKDSAGNAVTLTGSAVSDNGSYMVDTTAPGALGIALQTNSGSTSDTISNVGTLSVTGAETGATVEYSADGNTWSASQPVASEGANTVYVHQIDAAGNISTAQSFNFTLDTIAPAAPTVALANDSGSSGSDAITNVSTLNVTGTEVGATVQYSLDNTNWGASFNASQGANTVYVRQLDVAGNAGPEAHLSFTYDTVAPTVSGAAQISGTDATGTAKTTTLSVGDHVLVTINMSESVTVSSVTPPTYTLTLDGGATRTAAYDAALSNSTTLVFSYTVAAGDSDLTGGVTASANALLSTSGSIVDVAGNTANVNVAAVTSSSVSVDTTGPTVTNASVLNGVTDLDVHSPIVLNMGGAVTYQNGGLIKIANDSNTAGKAGFESENTDHTINLYLGTSTTAGGVTTIQAFQDAALTTASGTVSIDANGLVTLYPTHDLDLSNNYHIEIAANTFTKTSNGMANDAFGQLNGGSYALGFSTVTPGMATAGGSLAAAAASVKMGSDGTSMVAGHDWISTDLNGMGGVGALMNLDLSLKDYALVAKNTSSATGELGVGYSNFLTFRNFNAGDMLYFDDQNNAATPVDFSTNAAQVPSGDNGNLAFNLYQSTAAGGGTAGTLAFNGVAYTGSLADVSMQVIVA